MYHDVKSLDYGNLQRLRSKMEEELEEFRKGIGTRDSIALIRTSEKYIYIKKKIRMQYLQTERTGRNSWGS